MIYLTIIAEEIYRFKYSHWDTDPDEEYTIVDRHIFIYSPNNDKPIFPEFLSYYDDNGFHHLSLLGSNLVGNNTDFLSGIKLHEIKGDKFDGTPSIEDKKQYVDVESTRVVCEFLNRALDFTLYIPCFYVDPCSVGKIEHHSLGSGNTLETISPIYLPSPICRLSSYERCTMLEIKDSDFIKVKISSINSKRGKYILKRYISWNEERRQIVEKYLSGEIIPDEDEEEMYEQWVDEVKDEDREIDNI